MVTLRPKPILSQFLELLGSTSPVVPAVSSSFALSRERKRSGNVKIRWLVLAVFLLTSSFAFAGANQYILIQNYPWFTNYPNEANMTAALGSYTEYDFSANAATVFNKTCCFAMVEGGDGSQTEWENYLTSNSTTILNWVSNGGALLLQSAGWNDPSTFTFADGTFYLHGTYTGTGTLTAAGISAFTFVPTPATQSGNYLAHDWITGTGLTVFMTDANGNSLLSGEKYGNGYIMYSGLTTSQWHNAGYNLTTDIIHYTAGEATNCPEPGTLVLFGSSALGLAGFLRRKIKL